MFTCKSWPVDIPPSVPPEKLLKNPFGVISSLASEPFCVTTSNPAPISTPLTAFIDIIPCASNASNLSNTGSPKPIGIFFPITVT